MTQATEERVEAVARLRPWIKHTYTCLAQRDLHDDMLCRCGLDEALSALPVGGDGEVENLAACINECVSRRIINWLRSGDERGFPDLQPLISEAIEQHRSIQHSVPSVSGSEDNG